MDTNIFINHLGLKNFRSFDRDGIFLNDLTKVNLFIGKNNSGKSNVLKFLKILSDLKGSFGSYQNIPENQHGNTNRPASIFTKFNLTELDFPLVLNHSNYNLSLVEMDIRKVILEQIHFEYSLQENKFSLLFSPTDPGAYKNSSYQQEISISIINKLNLTGGYREPFDLVKNYYRLFFEKWLKDLATQIVYIPDIRIIKENNNIEKSNSIYNGANLTSRLSLMKNFEIGEDDLHQKLKSIESKIAEILDVAKVEIHIPEKAKGLY